MKTVRIASLFILVPGVVFGFLAEGPFGALIGFLLAAGFCVALCYVAGVIADNRIVVDPPREYVVGENRPKGV